jgi:hypothetical protein
MSIQRRVIMEGVEARGVSHATLIPWSTAAAMRSERSPIDSTRRSPVEDIPGLRCLRESPANAPRPVSCQIVTVDHLLPKVATLRNRCR